MTDVVSVIIPAYNAATYLRETLDSVLNQSWPRLEVLVVDDGSTDATASIGQSYAARGVRVIRQAGRGASIARNRGFAESTGTFIQYLDADDLLSPNKIATQVAALQAKPGGQVASCRWGRFRRMPADVKLEDGPQFRDLSPDDYFRTLLSTALGAFLPCHAWLTPRHLVESAGQWNPFLRLGDDADFFARVVRRAKGATYCDSEVAFYRRVPGSLSTPRDVLDVAQLIAAVDSVVEEASRVLEVGEVAAGVARAYGSILVGQWPTSRPFERHLAKRIALLGDHEWVPIIGGPITERLKHLLGWKLTRRLQRLSRTVRRVNGERLA